MDVRNLVAAGAFRIVQGLLLPVGIAGYVPFVARMLRFSRRTGTSATVLASFYTRYMQHRLGTRRDEPCARLMAVMPNISPLGLRLETAPTLVAHRLTGYVPRLYRYPYPGEPPMMYQSAARTTFYDAALERHLPAVDQLVVLGAGLDTRAYRLPPETRARVRCFEVDQPRTQAFKREMLAKAGIDTSGVAYVPADLEEEDWFDKLVAAGFDPDRPSIFLWESVTMYLKREAVERTLRTIAATAAGSVVAFDYFSTELIESGSLFMRYSRAVLAATGEPWHFGIDNTPPVRERVAEFLAACGLTLEEQRNFGPERDGKRAPAGFATAIVPAAAERRAPA
ncbi:MAG: class I SAM-dependent methyltransferase [Gemmatimonadetes bacterium]|nr:class I SAM-dependent methyltransferase [Gemmatimonadota bacterium]